MLKNISTKIRQNKDRFKARLIVLNMEAYTITVSVVLTTTKKNCQSVQHMFTVTPFLEMHKMWTNILKSN